MKQTKGKKQKTIIFHSEKDSKDILYKAVEEVYEQIQQKKEMKEKEAMFDKLNKLTQNKNIVLSNYMP